MFAWGNQPPAPGDALAAEDRAVAEAKRQVAVAEQVREQKRQRVAATTEPPGLAKKQAALWRSHLTTQLDTARTLLQRAEVQAALQRERVEQLERELAECGR